MATILIIEDSNFQRGIIKSFLTQHHYDILEAINGAEGIIEINKNVPDCIILDLLMPELNGFQTLKELKNKGINIPVIILTANIQESVKQKCYKLGAKAFLNKPFNPEEALEKLNEIFENK